MTEEGYIVERDYLNDGIPLVGNYPVDSFGSQVIMALRSGRSVSKSDVATDLSLSSVERAAYAAIGIVAYLCVPLVKGGEFVAGLVIHMSTSRVWTSDEIALVEEVAERTWAALERAHAEALVAANLRDTQLLTAALAERNQELDSFVYIVSHDLKAPLRAISNLSVWIEEDLGTELPAEIQQQMAQLRGRAQRMEGMINGLLDYARVGRTDTQLQLVSVAELLTEILDSLAPPSTFKIVIAPDLPTFHTKRLLLSQVFANLIGNAFKHHDRTDGFIRISCQEQGDFYEFTIVDDGPGIPQEQHDRVFIIFQSTNSQKNPDSTGIGLSIVKKIVETAGGQIRLESELGKGTTFYFTWPK